MQKEKLAIIGLLVIIIVVVSGFVLADAGIFDNLFGEVEGNETAVGDCVEVNYIGRYASNNSIFDSSYDDPETKTGGTPLKVFITKDINEYPPEGFEEYSAGLIDGFMNGLIGLKEGQTKTIGPIPPEEAYGIYPEVGDVIDVSDESLAQDMHLEFIDILENAPIPAEFEGLIEGDTTTLFILKDNSYIVGQKLTLYQSWENATVITKINDTMMWLETIPPEDQMNNFTWKELDLYGQEISYWEDSSDVTMNDTIITVTHNPEVGQTLEMASGFSTVEYTVVSLTDDIVNVSYVLDDGNISYSEIDRKIEIERNQTQNITYSWPYEMMDYVLSFLKQTDPTIPYSVAELAGETLLFEVTIEKVYKDCKSD